MNIFKKMMWQDWVMFFGQILFIVALIPSITSEQKPVITTSAINAAVMTIFTPTIWTINLRLTAFTSGIIALGWWILTVQVM